jgi:hypothetical protein
MSPHLNIHKYTWTFPDGKTPNQIDHILRDRRWHSNILDVLSFRGTDCDTDHYLVVAEVRERLATSNKQHRSLMGDRFNLRKLNELEVRKRYWIEISKRFAVLEDLSDSEDMENIKENIKTSVKDSLGLYELKQHKP